MSLYLYVIESWESSLPPLPPESSANYLLRAPGPHWSCHVYLSCSHWPLVEALFPSTKLLHQWFLVSLLFFHFICFTVAQHTYSWLHWSEVCNLTDFYIWTYSCIQATSITLAEPRPSQAILLPKVNTIWWLTLDYFCLFLNVLWREWCMLDYCSTLVCEVHPNCCT